MWLILSTALILAPFLYVFTVVFPLGTPTMNFLVLAMLTVFAVGLLVPSARYTKVRKNTFYMVGVAGAILLPVIFALTQVYPLLPSTMGILMFLLMHLVLASGFILAYSHSAALKNLI